MPLTKDSFKNGELEISEIIAENTYIEIDEFNLRAVELEAHTSRKGEVRLKVGRYVTPPVPLPGEKGTGLLRIEAPHKTNNDWHLLIEDRATITSLTAVLEPRHDNPDYYTSRYEQRGYSFGNDPYFRNDLHNQSRIDSWSYGGLGGTFRDNRSASHWLFLNDSRARFQLNPSFGFNHIHSRNCYDRFGRHLGFNGQLRAPIIGGTVAPPVLTRRAAPTRNYLHERNRIDRRVGNDAASIQQRQLQAQAALRAQQAQRVQQQAQRIRAQRAQQAQRTQQQLDRTNQQRADQQRADQQRIQRRQQRSIERSRRDSSRSARREAIKRQLD